MDFDQRLRLHYDSLSDNEKEMVKFIQSHAAEVADSSIAELGEKTLSSKSSVLRLAKKMGFQGFSELKFILKQSLAITNFEPTDLVAELRQDIQRTFKYVQQTNFQFLLSKMQNADNLVLYATGFSQNNATKEFANDLFISGRANFLISGESNFKIISNKLTAKDLVIVTSLSGNTPGIQDAIKILEINHVPLCSVTSFGTNYLTEHAHYSLYYEASQLPNINGQEPIYSMTCLSFILSILSRKYKEFILFDE
ncbi:MurR/RpiR family transcriptional regulator [Liquorilactobacillus hordei]|uniref:Transcriptional regulator n=1 Tax=Liquorilactobacillus hordei TaxID=468911 RepID=A0A3S6QRM9_9LACO|nr:MurR/RpiR family transcriptional regulator [Liquorilactobacillus hordei]AUJ30772.1 transcriptional regulator [Liquorilactobacillus hordei]